MKKKTLAQKLHKEYSSRYSKRKVYRMVNFLLHKMREALNSGDGLKVSGFGSFKKRGKRIIFKPSRKVLYRLKTWAKRSKI